MAADRADLSGGVVEEARHARVVIGLRVGADPIQGWVDGGGEGRQSFVGWLALTAALDRLRAEQPPLP